ncbi:MAG: AI-2E family transporter [Rickettsiales bacterium]|jgi:predicted PurR-regulated permease PerM|nr:AI-2E family transporter [Rickettsiales bacterium]
MLIYDKIKNNKQNILKYGLLLLSILTLYKIREVLLPFTLGVIFSYAFKNTVNKLEQKFKNRSFATIFIVLIFWSIITISFFYLIPFLVHQSIGLSKDLMIFLNNNTDTINFEINKITSYFNVEINFKDYLNSYFKDFDAYLLNILTNVFSTSVAIINALYVFIMTPITMYYFLNDWENIIMFLKKFFPIIANKKSLIFFKNIDIVLSACIKEQFYVCFLLGMFYAILLVLSGLQYGFIIGLLSGFATFIPYVGIIFGLIISLIVTLYQFGGDAIHLIITTSIFMSGLLLEMNLLLPNIVGKKINLHPLWVIFALVASGALLGFYGLLFALPIAGAIGVILRFIF